MGERLLKVAAVAERLDISSKSVYDLVYAGKLTPHHVGTGKIRPRVRIAESDLERYIRECAA